MIHKSKLTPYAEKFPHDLKGNVPVHDDHWQIMEYDHGEMDPHEEGISEEERNRRIEYLNTEWWPKILQRVQEERYRLEQEHGETFLTHWTNVVHQPPDDIHGFQAG